MNTQKYLIASVAAAVFLFVYGWVVYGLLLMDFTASYMPPGLGVPEGQENMLYIALGTLLQGFGLGLLYVKGHEGKGAMEGVRFGLFVGLFLLGIYVLMAGVTTQTLQGSVIFGVIDTIGYIGMGVVFASLYKK